MRSTRLWFRSAIRTPSRARLRLPSFHTSSIALHERLPDDTPTITVKFVNKDGSVSPVAAKLGSNLLYVAHEHDIDLEGACEASCACSTCHVILSEDTYERLPEPEEEEEDMLDLAFGLTDTSRLGCQVQVEEWMDGITVQLPKATRNMYVDGHTPKPH